MEDQLRESWQQLRDSVTASADMNAITMCVYLALGGLLAVYLRWLYARCSSSASDADSITRVFPVLTVVTTGVIVVVQSSLTLSLGLVGALSIVRFRAAIKEPEELVYLFLCIAIGLSLGAGQPVLALALVLVSTVFILAMHIAAGIRRDENLMLTISGAASHFGDHETAVLPVVQSIVRQCKVHRLDIEDGQGQVRIGLGRHRADESAAIVSALRKRLPECNMSYVNLNTLL